MKSKFGQKFRIISAIEKNDFRLLAHLLVTQNHPPNKPVDKLGNNILLVACSIGSIPMVQFIQSTYHLDIQEYNTDGMNAMHLAACNGHLKMIKWLDQQGVDTESKTIYFNRTSYDFISEMLHKNEPPDGASVMTPKIRQRLIKIKNYLRARYFESQRGYEIRKFLWIFQQLKNKGRDFGKLPDGVVQQIAEYI